ncbi:protein EARLY FLOWERING 3-like [Vigna umbellata]|uniref:protein EARLY FLOWERING 3-like n=1 Tax=Vigna umbellata TaxID=87088 RepID=UPI001F5EF833|nr:protein EARLY FLOWERING 3-like [Vigna umbellata]
MKRGNDDEKVAGPMFPRLHVNDAEKGGPRAPPRNKMALYEQLSVPSQRFNPRLLPLKPNSSSNLAAPPTSSTQGSEHGRSYGYPVRLPSQTPAHRAESYISRQSDGSRSNTSSVQLERRKRADDDDVHAYICSRIGHSNDKAINRKKFTPLGGSNFRSVSVQNDGERDPAQFGSLPVDMRKHVRSGNETHPHVSSSRQQPKMSVKNKSSGEVIDSLVMQAKVIPNLEDQDCSVPSIGRLHQDGACLQQECVAGPQSGDVDLLNSTRDMDNGNALVPKSCFHSAVNQTCPVEVTDDVDVEYHDVGTEGPLQKGNFDESGDVSKISMVTNLSSLIVSPDDVVGVLGQKHFWKARRKIANQQRVFAVQVFELHRLIKVQQLIASSPDVLLEDGAFLGKFPLEGSTPKTISLQVVVDPKQQTPKQKNNSEKQNLKTECSAENAVEKKTSFSSPKNGSHITNHTPFSGIPHQADVASDNRTSPWSFNQSPQHQWLIPVMSPSEGLVYKPYPGPAFTRTNPAGCGGPFGQAPLGATFMNPASQFPASHQVVGVSPFVSLPNHTHFSPYGMPVVNQAASGSAVEHVNQFAGQGSHGQNGHSSVEGANFNTQHNQSSSNLPVQRNGAMSHVKKLRVSKERRLQGSTASTPTETPQGIRAGSIAEGSDARSLSFHSAETRQQTQVIKVVPHNGKSATESAARIFQSIQEERKQHDLV